MKNICPLKQPENPINYGNRPTLSFPFLLSYFSFDSSFLSFSVACKGTNRKKYLVVEACSLNSVPYCLYL